ncbi:protease inhibitor I9 family protein [Corallococcus llansteffanensis]|nr:protease inhibitor I9 family protein [Corallococcus llansteffanensis]
MRNVRRPLMLLPWLILSACHPESEPSTGEASAEATGQTSRLLRAEFPVPGQYVVVLAPPAMGEPEGVPALAEALASKHGGQVLHVYQKALRGFSVRMTEAQALELARHPAVASIEEDAVVRDSFVQSAPGRWTSRAALMGHTPAQAALPSGARQATWAGGPLLLLTQHHPFWGGPRAGARLPGSVGSPRCSNRARTPPGAVRDASTRRLPPHLPHPNTSSAKLLRSNTAPSSRGVRSCLAAASGGSLASSGFGSAPA